MAVQRASFHCITLQIVFFNACKAYLLGGLSGIFQLLQLLVSLAIAPAQLLQLRQQPVTLLAHSAQLLFRRPVGESRLNHEPPCSACCISAFIKLDIRGF